MELNEFLACYREAFGEKAHLPLLFGYSDTPVAQTAKIGGCFFKGLQMVREGTPVSLNADVIGCGGGKLYTGFRSPRNTSRRPKWSPTMSRAWKCHAPPRVSSTSSGWTR